MTTPKKQRKPKQKKVRKPDLKTAADFLNKFNHKRTTLQITPLNNEWSKEKGKVINTGKKGGSVYSFTGSLLSKNQRDLLIDLAHCNHENYAVYSMVNEGDGIVHKGHKTSRSSDSVVNLKACFVDTDNGDIRKLLKFLKKIGIKFHIKVLSSQKGRKKKYHVYILIRTVPNIPENLHKWKTVQGVFAHQDEGFDDSMTDVAKLLRLPGFYHTKDGRTYTKVTVEEESDHAPYSLDELYELCKPYAVAKNIHQSSLRDTRPVSFVADRSIKDGDQYKFIKDRAFAFALKGVAAGEVVHSDDVREYIRVCEPKLEEYGQHQQDPAHQARMDRLAADAFKTAINKLDVDGDYDAETALQAVRSRLKEEQRITNSLADRPELCYQAPGLLGDIVTEWASYDPNPIVEFYLAAAMSLVGFLTARYIRSEYRNTPPQDYICCLAPTGLGKSTVKECKKHTIRMLIPDILPDYLGIIENVRSDTGFHFNMQFASGRTSLVLNDETHHFFRALKDEKAQPYTKKILQKLLDLYDGYKNPYYSPGMISSERDVLEPLEYPKLGFFGLGIAKSIEDIFDEEALKSGLLNRFLIIIAEGKELPEDIIEHPYSLPDKFKFIDKLQKHLSEMARLFDGMQAINEKEEKSDSTDAGDPTLYVVKFTPDAMKKYKQYGIGVNKEINAARRKDKEHIAALYIRKFEHVGRTAMSTGAFEITEEIVDWAIEFVEAVNAPLERYVESISSGEESRQHSRILKALDTIFLGTQEPVTAGRISKNLSNTKTWIIAKELEVLAREGKVQEVPNYRKGRRGKATTAYLPLDE